MLNKIFIIVGIIFILYPLMYFIINKITHITGYQILSESGTILYNNKIVGANYQYEKYIYKNDDGKWVSKNDIKSHEYVDPSNTKVINTAKILSYFSILPFLSPIMFIVGIILTILGLIC